MRPSIVWLAPVTMLAGVSAVASGQTTAGLATSIVFPVAAQTASFVSEMTLFNPGPALLTASVKFYEANNSVAPGTKVCNDVSVPAGRSVQITLAAQCALGASGGHFGLAVVTDTAVPASHAFYGYMRVQNPQGIGFSIEGFPASNFNNQVSEAIGLKKVAAAPTYQTNCFVGSLDQPVSYQLKLFNDSTGAQVGGTLAGSLAAFQQFRYLDVFGPDGVNAPAGDQLNVRAEFTQTSGGSANLIGFCTVQDNASFGADFRIAKSYGSPSGTFFAQGGNAFGATAHLGTNDSQPLELYTNGQRTMRYEPNATSPNMIGGYSENSVGAFSGQTIAGGGTISSKCFDLFGVGTFGNCTNRASGDFAVVGGGRANSAGVGATIAGGASNTATGTYATIAGGLSHTAYGVAATVGGGKSNGAGTDYATVAGGLSNSVSGVFGTVGGGHFNVATTDNTTVSGGYANQASGYSAEVAGGSNNVASGYGAAIAGGINNAAGDYSFVAGGTMNKAQGEASFTGGYGAIAREYGMFVWSDLNDPHFDPVALRAAGQSANTFNVRATGVGGVLFVTGINPTTGAPTSVCYAQNLSGWTCTSDRNVKRNLRPVDSVSVLEKVVAMPVYHWQPKDGINRDDEHLGPMAQDFMAGFGLGRDDKTIGMQDAEGVAFAAIQGLHRLLLDKDAQIQALQQRVDALQQRMADVESVHDDVAQLRVLLRELQSRDTPVAVRTRGMTPNR